jgi:hypothetical protein
MANDEAVAVLERELAALGGEPYADLVLRIADGPQAIERVAPSGTTYQMEIDVRWDARPNGNVRVIGSIDDGQWRVFVPLTRSFIKAPDDSFVEGRDLGGES